MDYSIIIDNLGLFLQGLNLTIQFTFLSVLIGFALAIGLAVMRDSKYKIVSYPIQFYIYFLRGTPLLVQIYLIYHGLAQFSLVRDTFLWVLFKEAYFCGLLAWTLNTSAYGAEILRGAFKNTPKGEVEAAIAFGMSKFQVFWRITFPSSIRRAFPAYSNEIILMLHATSLASTITLIDLTGAARLVYEQHYAPFVAFTFVGLVYLMITMILTWVFKWFERNWMQHLA